MEELEKLDTIDLKILIYLQKDGRKSFTDIAEEMNMSVGTIRNRYNKLLKNNVINIIAWVDPTKIGRHTYARLNIKVMPTNKKNEVTDKLSQIPQVSFVALTAGRHDIEVNLICENNNNLIDLMDNIIYKIEGVHDVNMTVYLKVLKWASQNIV
ncbi:MAG: Lrp/AsnC family transcriptional regulator [Flavobacteriales bacterium]